MEEGRGKEKMQEGRGKEVESSLKLSLLDSGSIASKKLSMEVIKDAIKRSNSKVGQGGAATIYSVKLEHLGKSFATHGREHSLGVVKMSTGYGENVECQFIAEVIHLCTFQHRGIVPLLGYAMGNEHFALVLPYYPKGDLSKMIESNMGWEKRIKIAYALAKSLSLMHQYGVTHVDLKASNVLIDEDDMPVITDFGSAIGGQVKQWYDAASVPGTRGTTSPETFTNGFISSKSDVYGFGVILIQLMMKKKDVFSKHRDATFHIIQLALSTECVIHPSFRGLVSKRDEKILNELILEVVDGNPQNRLDMIKVVERLRMMDSLRWVSV